MTKICMVSDVKGWAFDITAEGLRPYLDFDLLYTSDEPRVTKEAIEQYERVHFFNWLGGQSFAHMPGVSGGVCQHNYELKWPRQAKKYIPEFSKMAAISKEIFSDISKLNSNTAYIPNGVNADIFIPFSDKEKGDREFTVGWCGQKTNGGFGEKKGNEGRPVWDIKGYELILQPLMKRLEGKVRFKVNNGTYTNSIPHSKMPEWYKDIDCFICTSLYEGGPLPVLEAAACGIPVISTRVGIVPELIRHGYNGYLVDSPKSRDDLSSTLAAFETYIIYLKEGYQWDKIMGRRLRETIYEESWTWEKISLLWKKFFEN